MTQIDQFESIFRAASKTQFEYQDWKVSRILTIGDKTADHSLQIENRLKEFLAHAIDIDQVEWSRIDGSDFNSVKQLMDDVDRLQPDLICCRRNLHVEADEYPHSLGVYVEVLTQNTSTPVLLMPTESDEVGKNWHQEPKTVIAITDHLDDDALLVNSAVKLTAKGGTLFLAHIEDEKAYLRFMDIVGKIAEIDSEVAHERIKERLLLEPQEFIESCRAEIEKNQIEIQVEPVVQMGHHLSDYKNIVVKHHADLVVIHTKDEDQLAMHGVAYPLTVELHNTPMLLI